MSSQMKELIDGFKTGISLVKKVQTDVKALHKKIDVIGEVPTPEEWAEVKALSAEMNTNLAEVDNQTEDEIIPEG